MVESPHEDERRATLRDTRGVHRGHVKLICLASAKRKRELAAERAWKRDHTDIQRQEHRAAIEQKCVAGIPPRNVVPFRTQADRVKLDRLVKGKRKQLASSDVVIARVQREHVIDAETGAHGGGADVRVPAGLAILNDSRLDWS
jgi:hypothetical protein